MESLPRPEGEGSGGGRPAEERRIAPRRVAIVGAAGTGKTYQAQATLVEIVRARLAAGIPVFPLVVFDPTYVNWPLAGACRCETRLELLQALVEDRGPIVVTGVFENWHPLELVRNLLLVVDEAHNFATPHRIDRSFRRILCEGRHRGMDVIVATQRVRHLNPAVLANVTEALVLPVQHPSDRQAIEDGLGVSLRGRTWKRVEGHETAREPLRWPRDFSPEDPEGRP